MTFRPGDPVTWLHEQRGGYGFIFEVPATVVSVTAKRVTIDATLRRGGTKRISVKPEKLRPRPLIVSADALKSALEAAR